MVRPTEPRPERTGETERRRGDFLRIAAGVGLVLATGTPFVLEIRKSSQALGEVERQIGELKKDLASSNQQLKQANKQLKEFSELVNSDDGRKLGDGIKSLISKVDNLERQLLDAGAHLDTASANAAALAKQADDALGKAKGSIIQLGDAGSNLEATVQRLEKTSETIRGLVGENDAGLAGAANDLVQVQNSFRQTVTQLDTGVNDLHTLVHAVKEAEGRLPDGGSALTEISSAVSEIVKNKEKFGAAAAACSTSSSCAALQKCVCESGLGGAGGAPAPGIPAGTGGTGGTGGERK